MLLKKVFSWLTFQNDRFIICFMARPKEYNREKVVDVATQLFWKKGYHGTPLSKLVSVTGLNKHSLYKEFGSKAGLFDECLANYRQKVGQNLIDILRQKPLGLNNIRAFFENRIQYMSSTDFKGCLGVRCATEKEFVEDSALEQVKILDEKFEKAFTDCLVSAIESGELQKTADPKLLIAFLSYFQAGMMVLGMPKNGKTEAEKIIDMIMSAITIK
jgi:AcrR family transcriptional regulator